MNNKPKKKSKMTKYNYRKFVLPLLFCYIMKVYWAGPKPINSKKQEEINQETRGEMGGNDSFQGEQFGEGGDTRLEPDIEDVEDVQVEFNQSQSKQPIEKNAYLRKVLRIISRKKIDNTTPFLRNKAEKTSEIEFNQDIFSKTNIQIQSSNFEVQKVDYDIIQFGKNGMRILIDYTSNFEKDPRIIQFMRGLAIRNSLARISSFTKVKIKEKWGPFTKKELAKCADKFVKVSEFYENKEIGQSYRILGFVFGYCKQKLNRIFGKEIN